MRISSTPITYKDTEHTYEGFLAFPEDRQPHPLLIIAPTVRGRTALEEEKAMLLAELGYSAFVLDVYGGGKQTREPQTNKALMDALNADRPKLLQRLLLGINTAKSHPSSDAKKVGALGYCFGGKCVLDLARANTGMLGVASFHGVLNPPPTTSTDDILSQILVLHGWDDPLATPEDVNNLSAELTARNAHWELVAYGHTGHAFTNPNVHNKEGGFFWQEQANDRSWKRMLDFFEEVFD